MKSIKKQEVLAYIITGILTAIINIVAYQLFLWAGLDYRIANAIALILTKLSAYVLSKRYVFHTQNLAAAESFKEFVKFFVARGATGLIDFFGLILLVDGFGFSPLPSKYFMMVLVIVLNYVFSKVFVFNQK